jgi:Fe-S-cluster containining protein
MPISQNFLKVCTECKAFCCKIVRPVITEQERRDILNGGFRDYFINIGDGIYEISDGENDKCPYLKNDCTCEIQSVKPNLCRIWPIVPHIKNNKRGYLLIKCPLSKHIADKELELAVKEAGGIPLLIIQHLWDISKEKKNLFKRFKYQEIG